MESRNGSMTGAASSAAPSRPARDETATVMLPGQERYPPYREEVSAIVVNHAGGVFFGIKRNNMLSLPEGGVIRGEWPIDALRLLPRRFLLISVIFPPRLGNSQTGIAAR